MTPPPGTAYSQGVKVLLTIVLAAAITGYFSGLRHPLERAPQGHPTHPPTYHPPTVDARAHAAPIAVSYSELRTTNLGPNRNFYPSLQLLAPPQPATPDEIPPPANDAAVKQTLAKRTQRRAFDGAPPTAPHPITQLGSESCLICHGPGVKIGDTTAPTICHEHLANCTQCHVEDKPGGGALGETLPNYLGANDFTPLTASLWGERAWQGAPPTIPHTTWMRTDCMSCHGPAGSNAIRTTHPWRQSCLQCHASSATLDQRPDLTYPAAP